MYTVHVIKIYRILIWQSSQQLLFYVSIINYYICISYKINCWTNSSKTRIDHFYSRNWEGCQKLTFTRNTTEIGNTSQHSKLFRQWMYNIDSKYSLIPNGQFTFILKTSKTKIMTKYYYKYMYLQGSHEDHLRYYVLYQQR